MTMQYPNSAFPQNKAFPDKYKKKLFVDSGFGYKEVKARVIEPYSPPTPQLNMREIRVINGPSHFHQMGLSSYKCSLTLLFDDRQSLDDYLMFCGWTHKFYDEKGYIYLGSLANMKQTSYESNTRYKVEIELVLIKKDAYDTKHRYEFIDLVEPAAGRDYWAKQDIEEMADLGLIAVIDQAGEPVLYFRPGEFVTRAEFITFLNRTRRLLERIIHE